VPDGVKFLTAAVDVQKDRFVVQVIGWGADKERWIVDRYNLRYSKRQAGTAEAEPVDPAGRIEDWWLLVGNVLFRPYPLAGAEQTGLKPLVMAVDSGGKAGVTERAYLFWKRCRAAGLGRQVMLVKGASSKVGPRVSRTFPDSSHRTQRKANARGEIPVFALNTQILKDAVAADLERGEPGPGYIHLPAWLGAWFFDELTSETRTAKGWENLGGARNEAFDLMVYNEAAWLTLGGEKINWLKPPDWAKPEAKAVPLAASAPAPDPQPVQPAPTRPRAAPTGNFINRPSGQPWIRR
jgi:phage terminase large subunit GpA-like protein